MKKCNIQVGRWIILLLAVVFGFSVAEARRLVDAETKAGLPLASVTDYRGNVIALTNNEGEIPSIPENLFPVTFSYVGYTPVQVSAFDNQDIPLSPSAYQLPEMVVAADTHPFVYMKGYMRAVTTVFGSTDSVTLLNEGIVDFMIPVGKTKMKGWNKVRELASRVYERRVDSNGDISVNANSSDPFLIWIDKFPLMPESVASNAPVFKRDTIVTEKYGPKLIRRRNGNSMWSYSDALADRKDHTLSPSVFKILGMTTDITDYSLSTIHDLEDDGSVRPLDISQISMSLNATMRGKLIKKAFHSDTPVDVKFYNEIYITDIEYLTTDEARHISKHKPKLTRADIVAPAGTSPLHPGLQALVNQVHGK